MISRRLFWIASLALAAAGLVTGTLSARFLHQPHWTSRAAWKEVYRAPRQLVRGVDAIAVATAVEARPGRTATSENGEDVLRFELVDFDVVRGLKGVETSDRITLERAAASEGGVFLDYDGGPFEIGQTYLLFLKRQGEGDTFYQVNDQGRYRLANDRLEAAEPDDQVAAHFHDRTLKEGLVLIREALSDHGRRPR